MIDITHYPFRETMIIVEHFGGHYYLMDTEGCEYIIHAYGLANETQYEIMLRIIKQFDEINDKLYLKHVWQGKEPPIVWS